MIRKANLEEAKLIYKENMELDFPDDEIPDYKRYLQLTEKNIHDVYIYEQNGKKVAYFITLECNNSILITHLAVMRKFRSQGIGKILLSDIKDYFTNINMLIVEVEAESRANNNEELNIIKRRKKYYLNSGFTQCSNMNYVLYGVQYDILVYIPNKEKEYTSNEVKSIIKSIYLKVGINESKLKIDIDS